MSVDNHSIPGISALLYPVYAVQQDLSFHCILLFHYTPAGVHPGIIAVSVISPISLLFLVALAAMIAVLVHRKYKHVTSSKCHVSGM